jgi:hypothetical protein
MKARQCGHALAEMAMVLAMLTILAAIALPKAGLMATGADARASEQLLGALRQTRAAAIAAGLPARASFSPGAASFCWIPECPAAGGTASPVVGLGGAALHVDFPSGASLAAPAHIDFAADGSAAPAAILTVGNAKISIDASTGVPSRVD